MITSRQTVKQGLASGVALHPEPARQRPRSSRPISALCLVSALSTLLIASPAPAQTLYWTDVGTSRIQRAALTEGTGVENLVASPQVFMPVAIALDLTNGRMYWTEASPADFMIGRANLDGSDAGNMITGLTSPSGIALDLAGGKLYWSDVGTGKIQRANLDGTGIEDLVTSGTVTPVDIALDLNAGKIYWTEASPADFMIARADLDGSNVEGLVTGLSDPSGIALDPAGGKMYWTDKGAGKIQRANLDGTNLEDLVTEGLLEPVRIALDLAAGKLYWTEASPADFMISRASLDGSDAELLVEGLTSPSGIALAAAAGGGSPIPTVSQWGLLATLLLILGAGTVILRRRAGQGC